MRRPALLALLLTACSFDPATPVPDKDAGPIAERDAGVVTRDGGNDLHDAGDDVPDGGVDRDGGDVNEIDGGQDNQPPVPRIGPDREALPWDTVELSASATVDPDGDSMTYSWAVTVPPGASSGFGVFPGDQQTVGNAVDVELYVSVPGDYFVTMSVSDGGFVRTATLTVTVNSFEVVPLPEDDEVETVLVSPWDGALWIGTKGKGLNRLGPGAAPPPDVIGCVSNSKINALASTSSGTIAVAADDGVTVFDGDCRPPPMNVPTKMRAAVTAENDEDFYFSGEPGVHLLDTSTNMITTFPMDFAGEKQKFRGAARDGSGVFWFASESNDPDDGIAGSTPPPDQSAMRIDVFPGADDQLNAIRAGAGRELWIVGGPGVAQIASTNNPTAILRFTPGAGIPSAYAGPFEDVGIESRGDVWIAAKDGLLRYKRDVSVMVAIPRGEFGIPDDAEMRGIAIDRDRNRGRTVYAAGKAGLHAVHAAPAR